MYSLIRSLLFLLPTEVSHNFSLRCINLAFRSGILGMFVRHQKTETVSVMGVRFPNRIGLAAGLDKNGDYIDALCSLGFGFVEIGTVTPLAQTGNEKPRLFRLVSDRAIINRMGFNNRGVEYLINNVKKKCSSCILGINIGKNKLTPNEEAVSDYQKAYAAVYRYADYVTINISSPNTPGLREMQHGEYLQNLIRALKTMRDEYVLQGEKYVPLVIKIAPDLDNDDIDRLANVFIDMGVDGVIATNTTLSRDSLTDRNAAEEGGLSGRPLTDLADRVLERLVNRLKGKVAVIAAGGVMTKEDAQRKFKLGADLVQIYTGFVYSGPSLIRDCVSISTENG